MKFTIRDLLWLTLLAAVVTAWWVDRRQLGDQIEQLQKQINLTFWGDAGSSDLGAWRAAALEKDDHIFEPIPAGSPSAGATP